MTQSRLTARCSLSSSRRAPGCRQAQEPPQTKEPAPVAQSREMGGAKSVMTFFVTSKGPGKGGDLGGLAGADAHCQALAQAEGAGDHTWRAYLSTSARDGQPAINARDRIGKGPWYNAEGLLIAANLDELHSDTNRINKETAVTERLDPVNGVGDDPNVHDILTGSRPDGTAYAGDGDLACRNWTSSSDGTRAGRASRSPWADRGPELVEFSPRFTRLRSVGSAGDWWGRTVLLLRHRLTIGGRHQRSCERAMYVTYMLHN